jgi:hypothetical protein
MRKIEQNIDRRAVVEAYATYDCSKRRRPLPNFATWDWSHADAIDEELNRAELKTGVPAGYKLWDKVEVTILDLRECAVCAAIFPGQSRKLGLIECAGKLVGWKPDRDTCWYPDIVKGKTFDDTAPMMFRPAVRGEQPARWYIEDGSGRATAFVANHTLFGPSQTLAIGYLGRQLDASSSYMQERFPELFIDSERVHR